MNTKIIAFYLPQFHSIIENDNWWGKGFTEWERLRKAKPLFEGHNQPRIPYEYYDLSDTKVLEKQSKLAQEYKIHGFCYYHYWFNGHKLLQKPIEDMLNNPNITIPFCLSWANEPWTRAWDGKSKQVLMPQNYGEHHDWIDHIDYLLPFFQDKRYIKIDNKPVFLIYRTESFNRFEEMINTWNIRLKENGIEELYLVEMLTSFQKSPKLKNSSAVVEFEPMLTVSGRKSIIKYFFKLLKRKFINYYKKKYTIYSYPQIVKKISERNIKYYDKTIFFGAFPDWDNTPRFKEKGTIFENSSPELFGNLLSNQLSKSKSEFLFINAWNEWTEGAYIEPDENRGFCLLETIKNTYERSANS